MRSRVSLLLALAAAPLAAQIAPLPPEAASVAGPSGTAGMGSPGAYDAVVRSTVAADLPGAAIAAPLPVDSQAEVTALADGRTIVVLVAATAPEVRLSPAAAQALGLTDGGGVRVRAVTASPADAAALRRGQLASPRLDTPDAVLRPLRRQLPAQASVAPARRLRAPKPPRSPAATAPAARAGNSVLDVSPPPPTSLRVTPPPTSRRPAAEPVPPIVAASDVPETRLVPPVATPSRVVVQVATYPQEERARNVARSLRASAVRAADGWQVRLGPFADLAAAQAARDDALARGYADAAIFIAD